MVDKLKHQRLLPWLLLFILALIWGSSFILIKKGLVVFSAGEVGSIRILTASLFLLPLALPRLKGLKARQWKLLFLTGLLGNFFPAFLFAIAQTQLSSSLTGVLNALTPLFVLIIGALFFTQKIVLKSGIGLLVGFVGTAFLVLTGSPGHVGDINYYAFFVVLATICYGINLNLIKYYFKELTAVEITSISLFLVGPIAGIYLFAGTEFVANISTKEGAWLGFFYVSLLGVLGTAIALILFNHLVKLTTPVFTSFVTYLIPIVAVIWGMLDGEVLFVGHYLGMAAIIVGVFVAAWKGRK